MKRYRKIEILLLAALISGLSRAVAQPCPEDPATKKGHWIYNGEEGFYAPSTHPVTLRNKKSVSALLDTIALIIRRYNPEPAGSEAVWYKTFDDESDSVTCPDISFGNYMYNSLYHPYVCSNGVIKADSETATWLFIHVNGFWPSGCTLQHEFNKSLGEKLFTLPPQRGTLGGYPVFEPTPKGEEDSPWLLFYSVLIHQPGKLPYIPVTKGELFDLYEKLIQSKQKEYQEGIEFQRKNMGEEWYNERTESVKKQFEEIRSNLTALKKLYTKELNQPAILKSWDYTLRTIEIADPTQKKFFTTANRGYQLVRTNPDYMDQKQEKWKPQFMWVEWRKPVAMKNAIELDRVMKEKFDFKELGNLLTK